VTVGNLDVGILTVVSNLNVDSLTLGNFDVDIMTVGNLDDDIETKHHFSGTIAKPSILPPDPVEEALTPNKKLAKKKSKSGHENLADNDELSKIEMSLRLVCSMSGNYAKAWYVCFLGGGGAATPLCLSSSLALHFLLFFPCPPPC
jgi:hypothetical protein